MDTRVDEIAERIYRISTLIPDIPPAGFSMNQFLVDGDEPLLFHCGPRQLFPLVRGAVSKVMDVDRLRWISFGHVEADESGAMNLWLQAAPRAQVVHGQTGCQVSIEDLADRKPRAMGDGEVLDLGGRSVRLLATPHVPHNWESIVLFEEATRTLFSGDTLTNAIHDVPLSHASILENALMLDEAFGANSYAPGQGDTLRRLADLAPTTLAIMHGASFTGDCAAELRAAAEVYDRKARRG